MINDAIVQMRARTTRSLNKEDACTQKFSKSNYLSKLYNIHTDTHHVCHRCV